MTRAALSAWEVQDWLVGRITATLRLAASEVTSESVFSELGLSSVQGVQLAADLEDVSLRVPDDRGRGGLRGGPRGAPVEPVAGRELTWRAAARW
jgi:hypothetical protein